MNDTLSKGKHTCKPNVWQFIRSVFHWELCRYCTGYLTACLKLLGVWAGSRWHWQSSWRRWERRGLWAGCWEHGTSCSPAAELPPAAPCRPSSSAPGATGSLQRQHTEVSHLGLRQTFFSGTRTEDAKHTECSRFSTYQVVVLPGSILCRSREKWVGPEEWGNGIKLCLIRSVCAQICILALTWASEILLCSVSE